MRGGAEEEEEEVECVWFPCGVFPGMESFSIYSLACCDLFSSTETYKYWSLFCVLAGGAGSVVVPISDVCRLEFVPSHRFHLK